MNIKITNNVIKSNYILEEFFPIIVKYDFEELNNDYLSLSYQNSDLIELSLNKDNRIIKKIVLTLCNHYCIKNEIYQTPDYTEGTIHISDSGNYDCEIFALSLYNNCAVINFSSCEAKAYTKSGNVLFGITDNNSICKIIFLLGKEEYNHIKFELENA